MNFVVRKFFLIENFDFSQLKTLQTNFNPFSFLFSFPLKSELLFPWNLLFTLIVRKISNYHSTVLVHRVKLSRVPQYLYDMYNFDERLIGTREAGLKLMRLSKSKPPKTELAAKGFRWRSCQEYNMLPLEVRSSQNMDKFKKMAKAWIKDNIPLV